MLYKIFGVLLITIAIMTTINSYKKISAIHNGKEVEVTVIDIPISCHGSNKALKAYFKFTYKDKVYSKNIRGKYCQILKIKKTIKLKTNQDNSIFVYPDENLTVQYISIFILFLAGLFFLFKKNKS